MNTRLTLESLLILSYQITPELYQITVKSQARSSLSYLLSPSRLTALPTFFEEALGLKPELGL